MRIPFFSFFLLCAAVQAAEVVPQNIDQHTETTSSITSTSASRWGLTETEWARYQQLKLGERGIWSPHLDPLTTLGVEATTDAERQKYAELLVEKEYQRVEKELAFQRAYDRAWQKRYANTLPIALPFSPISSDTQRLALFVSENCPACDVRLKALLESGKQLDIYLVGSKNDDSRLRHWALSQHIDIAKVKKRQITLNHDSGRWQQYGQQKLPAVLEKRGNVWLPAAP